MATKQQRIQRQNALIAVHAQATAQLMAIQGVVKVGVGLKEVVGQPTDEICFRVYVQKEQTDPVVIVPADMMGFPTEVVQIFQETIGPLEHPGPETDKRDETEHRPLKGGISASTKSVTEEEKEGKKAGTLGWFATRVPGNSKVALTNAHVLWPGLTDSKLSPVPLEGPDKFAQPVYDKTCCCEYHVIGERIIGIKSADVDCGIASLTEEPALIIGNNSTAVTLRVDGSAVAAIGDKVRKIGKRSGYTEGIVIDVGAFPADTMVSVPTIPGGTRHEMIKTRVQKILIWPTTRSGFTPYFDDHAYQMSFSNEGDSGSVVIDEDNKIIGLIYAGEYMAVSRAVGIACHIDAVMTALNDALKAPKYGYQIELLKSPAGDNSGIAAGFRLPRALTLNDLIRESDTSLAALVRRHREEVARLIDHCRPVTVAWHRHQGPAFTAAFNRNHRERAYRIPHEIIGVSRHELLVATARVLAQHGSAALQEDLRAHGLELIDEFSRADNVRALFFPPPARSPVVETELAEAGRNGPNSVPHGH